MREVFVVLTGAYGNVGDGVIRRRIVGWVRDTGAVHAYVGNAPADWVEQLGLRPDETVYASASGKAWMIRLMFGRGKRALIFDPGQIPLGRNALKAEALFLMLTAWTRVRGGVVIRPPRAFAGNVNKTSFLLHRLACRLSNLTLWRTPRALARMGVGKFSPDTAFQEQFVEGVTWSERDLIVISMRGKRSFPSPGWFRAVEELSASLGGRIVVVSQVREDEVRSSEIAEALRERGVNAGYQAWGDGSDLAQEQVTRSLYQEAKVAVSDRLHVLILAAKGGALPIEFTDHHPSKAEEHFAAINYSGVSLLTSSDDVDAVSFIETFISRRPELLRMMDAASAKLDVQSATVKRLLK